MRSRKQRPFGRTRCGLAAVVAVAGLVVGAAPAASVESGEPAPQFNAPALEGGGTVSLSEHRGKVVYLDFWASWCPPCRTAMPVLEGLRREFAGDAFQVVAVNLDRDKDDALEALEKTPVGYPSASDPDGRLPEQFGVGTMPTGYLIDRSGVVRYVHEGFRRGDGDRLREEIRALLGKGD